MDAGGLGRAVGPSFPGLATGASCADIDRDGDLDVYISYWKVGAVGPEAQNALYQNDGFFLFTDLSNPISNRVYERIGYRRVGEVLDVHFQLGETSD